MMRLIGSDFLFWSALHVARDQVIKLVLATPPELLAHANPREHARIDAMLDHILPVSLRAEGLRSDTAVGKHLLPSPLESIRAPTLVISARDDRYGTFASAQYTASQFRERGSSDSTKVDTRGSTTTMRCVPPSSSCSRHRRGHDVAHPGRAGKCGRHRRG